MIATRRYFALTAGLVGLALVLEGAIQAHAGEPVTFFDDKPLNLQSPDGRFRLISEPSRSGRVALVVVSESIGKSRTGRQVIGAYEPPTSVMWSPRSDAFFINDQRGSGQTSYLQIVRLQGDRFQVSAMARARLSALYKKLFKCRFSDEFVVTRGEDWWDERSIVVTVQSNNHSGGCPLDPLAANQITVVLDSTTEVVREGVLPRN